MADYSYYRRQAEEALQFARRHSQEPHRAALLGLAKAWQELAEAEAEREARKLQTQARATPACARSREQLLAPLVV